MRGAVGSLGEGGYKGHRPRRERNLLLPCSVDIHVEELWFSVTHLHVGVEPYVAPWDYGVVRPRRPEGTVVVVHPDRPTRTTTKWRSSSRGAAETDDEGRGRVPTDPRHPGRHGGSTTR